MCSTVASSPILAVHLAERALTICNYSQNYLLALFVNVIGSASAGAAQHGTCVKSISANPHGFLYVPEWLRANFCWHCITGCNTPLAGALIALCRYSCLQVASFPSTVAPEVECRRHPTASDLHVYESADCFGEDSEAQSNIYPNEFVNTLLP